MGSPGWTSRFASATPQFAPRRLPGTYWGRGQDRAGFPKHLGDEQISPCYISYAEKLKSSCIIFFDWLGTGRWSSRIDIPRQSQIWSTFPQLGKSTLFPTTCIACRWVFAPQSLACVPRPGSQWGENGEDVWHQQGQDLQISWGNWLGCLGLAAGFGRCCCWIWTFRASWKGMGRSKL